MGIIEAVKYFYSFVARRFFTILSGHRTLLYIFNSKPVCDRLSARLQRWAITSKQYNYTMEYQKGEVMFGADTFSRLFVGEESVSLDPKVN